MTDRRDDLHLVEGEDDDEDGGHSVPPPPTEPTLEGIARSVDQTREWTRMALNAAGKAAMMAEQSKIALAEAAQRPPVIVHMPAPPPVAAWTATATVLGGIGAFLGGVALFALAGWIVVTGETPAPPARQKPEPVVWSSNVVPIP